jgi:hypothetical protein
MHVAAGPASMARPPRNSYRGSKRRLRQIRLRDHLTAGTWTVIAIATIVLIAIFEWSLHLPHRP